MYKNIFEEENLKSWLMRDLKHEVNKDFERILLNDDNRKKVKKYDFKNSKK